MTGRGKCFWKRCTSNGDDHCLDMIVKRSLFEQPGKIQKDWTEAGDSAIRATVTQVFRNRIKLLHS